jgi:methylated-DNA-[protein]-cysteine S-methyltransferase
MGGAHMDKKYFFYDFPVVGKLAVGVTGGFVTDLHFEKADDWPQKFVEEETQLHREVKRQLTEYFSGVRKTFELPLAMTGTDFQKRCWSALREIPYGETRSYGDMARAVGSPKAFRAVGMANHRNPIAIIVPCHRVIGSNGSLTGFGGGLDVKAFLLSLEKKYAHI